MTDHLSRYALVASMGFMTALVVTQVFFRYALSNSIDWADEMSRLMFVWSMFLAIPHGIRAGVHVGIDLLLRAFSERVRDAIVRTMLGCSGFLAITVAYFCIYVIMDKWQEKMPTIEITAAVYYIPVLISMAHSFLHLSFLTLAGNKSWEDER
jgi:TRAP-type C4-dicarboxylate transport system permease small subunit